MRPSWKIGNLAGTGALVATLLLSGPGVSVVRAQEGQLVSAVPAGPVCSADAPVLDEAQLGELERRLQQLRAKPPSGEPVVVLNTRGYGYAPTGQADLESIRHELMRIQREAR